jgi:aerobic carbon-monoxide dehydrogenase large subunit
MGNGALGSTGPYIGRSLSRFEDLRLVTGKGRFTDDQSLPGQTHGVFVRSPHAHARILKIDSAAARALPGVIAVLTAADYKADGRDGVEQMPTPSDVIDYKKPAFVDQPGRPVADLPQWPFAEDRARFPGEAVALVVAETLAAARDGAEAIEVDYAPEPAVTDLLDALAPGAPLLWPEIPDNIAFEAAFGDQAATEAAMAAAEIIVEHSFRNQRIANAQMEPRAALGAYDAAADSWTLVSGSQGVARQRTSLAQALKVPAERIRVVSQDVGGGFGARTMVYPEQLAVLWAARMVGRPVKWTSDRTEAFLTDFQGRDMVTEARLALDRSGKILGYAVKNFGNVGAHTLSYVPLNNGYRVLTTVYHVPAAYVTLAGVMTNTVQTGPYRGAGRPEATFVMERMLDLAARRLGLDSVEIRRRNLITHDKLPYRSPMGLTYDSGDFVGNMEHALKAADWAGFPARRDEAATRGCLAGIGVANYVESPVGAPHERVEVTVKADGTVDAVAGTQSTGQGHETSFAQVLADGIGVRPDQIRLLTGDTNVVRAGGGSHSDRSMRLAGTLLVRVSADIVAQAGAVAAAMLGVDAADVAYKDGLFQTTRQNRRLSLFDIAQAIETDPALPDELRKPLAAVATFTGRIPAHPTGTAICELEIDRETGTVAITRYTSVDDAGQPINPLILHGQVHGGIAQGVGQALTEGMVYDPESGQVLNASFMDYGMPRADMLPSFAVEMTEDPTSGNPLRVKGGGESGITPALAAVGNAVADALAPLGVEHVEMPASPHRVWQAIRNAEQKGKHK